MDSMKVNRDPFMKMNKLESTHCESELWQTRIYDCNYNSAPSVASVLVKSYNKNSGNDMKSVKTKEKAEI